MAEPLLTSLCAICHVEPPKYKCPRCTIRTCSLACTKRHKAWSSCNGIRDATAYVPPSKLKTPAGVDHDFNFLSGIERAVQRSEKEIVEDRRLMRAEELRPIEVRSVQWKTGKDGRKRRVLVTEVLRGDHAGVSGGPLASLPVRKRLEKFGILLRRAPAGMARQKENGTNFSKGSGRINWQVEWMLLPAPPTTRSPSNTEAETSKQEKQEDSDEISKNKAKRILAKTLDDIPLYRAFVAGEKAFHDNLVRKEQQQKQLLLQQDDVEEPTDPQDINTAAAGGRHKKRRKHPHKPGQSLATAQDTETGTWHPGRYCLQTGPRGAWTPYAGVTPFTGISEEVEAQMSKYDFYLAGTTSAVAAAAGKTVVHAVDATIPLGEALRDMTVFEFPTIYVVESGLPLPSFLLAEPKPLRLTQKRKRDDGKSLCRKGGKGVRNKKLRRGNLEEGELPSDGESDDANEGEDRFAAAIDQIIAEESLGEDDDDESMTSSSGSDSETDESVSASLAAKMAFLQKRQP